MAKKTAKKTTKKKVAKAAAKKTAKKTPAKKAASKKPAAKTSTTKKPAAKKAATKKPAAKKAATKKPAAKKAASKKAPAKKTEAKKPAAKKTASKKADPKKADTKPAAKTEDAKADDKKSGRKGITIVNKQKTTRKAPAKKYELPKPVGGGLAALLGKPLIPSGSTAEPQEEEQVVSRRKKSPLTKKQLDNFRDILVTKRAELLGDIDAMEGEALKSSSGSLSSTPQHAAEQGSDVSEQSLSLDLAAADRDTIREIDAALQRINDGVYGLCEETNQPIPIERLESIPWARLTIAAAEARDRQRFGR